MPLCPGHGLAKPPHCIASQRSTWGGHTPKCFIAPFPECEQVGPFSPSTALLSDAHSCMLLPLLGVSNFLCCHTRQMARLQSPVPHKKEPEMDPLASGHTLLFLREEKNTEISVTDGVPEKKEGQEKMSFFSPICTLFQHPQHRPNLQGMFSRMGTSPSVTGGKVYK